MSASAFRLLDYLFQQPVINVNAARVQLEISYQAANALIREMREVGVLGEITGGNRNRIFRFGPYLDLFQDVAIDQGEIAEQAADALLTKRTGRAYAVFVQLELLLHGGDVPVEHGGCLRSP